MNDQQDRPQTLLEAAKALVGTLEWSNHWAKANLIAAIDREEQHSTTHAPHLKWAEDRAQQAEASAAWHKAESERLSAELAKAKEFRSYAEEAANFGGKWRERAEDAEAKVRNLQRQNREVIDERDRLRLHTETIEYRLRCVRQALGVAP